MPLTRIKNTAIGDGGITTAKLADGSVTTVKVADSAVNSAKIGVDVIAAEDLAANSVTVSEITDGAVTSAKLDTNIAIDGNLLVGSSSAVGNANANDLELTNSGGSGVVGMTFNVNSGSANTGNIYWRSNAANNNIQIVGDPITNYLAFATGGAEKLRIDIWKTERLQAKIHGYSLQQFLEEL
jgi:hypothetical protein